MRLIVVPWLPSAKKGFVTYAITLAPFVFILPEWKNDPGILAHEQSHLDRIKSVGWLKWYWNYVFNIDFRRKEEDMGYMIQRLAESQKREGNV